MVSKVLSFLLPLFTIFIFNQASKNEFELPNFYPFETGILAAEIRSIEKLDAKSPSCEQKIAASLEQKLDDLGIDFRTNVSNIIRDQRKFNKICKEFLIRREEFSSCPKPRSFIHKFGIVSPLEIACRLKKNLVLENAECLAGMESRLKNECRQACISQNYRGMDKLFEKNPELHCTISTCISRCINEQVQECTEAPGFRSLYNELTGAQMLLGIENVLRTGSTATGDFVQSTRLPTHCRRVIWRSVITAGNFSGMQNQNIKQEFNPF